MSRQDAAVLRLVASRERMRGTLAADAEVGTLSTLVVRLVQRHPWTSAALSMLAGGLLVRARAWRWVLKPELVGALLPTLMSALAALPLGSWTGLLSAFISQLTPTAQEAPTAPAAPPQAAPQAPPA